LDGNQKHPSHETIIKARKRTAHPGSPSGDRSTPDPAGREELVRVLSDLLLEAVGMDPLATPMGKEEDNES
jgi:hypothetical protein